MTNTIDNLKERLSIPVGVTSVVTSSGEYRLGERNSLGHFINYSAILTRLIQEAGMVTTSYASDLFISWESFLEEVESSMKLCRDFTVTTFMGFRKHGVDGPEYIEARFFSPEIYGNPYQSIFRLDLSATYHVYDMSEPVYEVSLALVPVYRKEVTAPIYAGTNSDGEVVEGYLVTDPTGVYLLPAEEFSQRVRQEYGNGKEKAEVKFSQVDPGTLRRA